MKRLPNESAAQYIERFWKNPPSDNIWGDLIDIVRQLSNFELLQVMNLDASYAIVKYIVSEELEDRRRKNDRTEDQPKKNEIKARELWLWFCHTITPVSFKKFYKAISVISRKIKTWTGNIG